MNTSDFLKQLSFCVFIAGVILFFGMFFDFAPIPYSSGIGLVLMAVITPLLAITSAVFRDSSEDQKSPLHERSGFNMKLVLPGLGVLALGIGIYGLALLIPGLDSLIFALFGGVTGFMGLVMILVALVKQQ